MKRIFLLFTLIFITACTNLSTAATPVEDYLSSYNKLEYEVLVDMEKVVEEEKDLTSEQRDLYRDILKKQYQDLKYEIVDEAYNEDNAVVTVKISVYDYFKENEKSAEYLKNNVSEFNDSDNKYDASLYMDYKLKQINETTDRVEYELTFNVVKENDVWKLNEITESDLEKIHGIFDYNN